MLLHRALPTQNEIELRVRSRGGRLRLSRTLESAGFEIRQRFTEQAKPVPFQLVEAVLRPA